MGRTPQEPPPAAAMSSSSSSPASQAYSATKPTSLAVCVVANARNEISLITAMSLLRLQIRMMTERNYAVGIHFVRTFDDALNVVYSDPELYGGVVVDGTLGFSADFVLASERSGLPLVAGVYPLPTVDWERVKAVGTGDKAGATPEPPSFWGNAYNVSPLPGSSPHSEYIRVDPNTATLGLVWVRRSDLDQIVRSHPEVRAAGGAVSFATPGTYDGVRLNEYQRFLQLYGYVLFADIARQASSTGPTEFGGCVGYRSVLR